MRPVRGKRILAVLAAGGLALTAAACGDAPAETPSGSSTSAAAAYKACMVTDTGGIDDKSFNASAWAGLQAAKTQASNVDPKYVASTAEADYEPNLRGFVTQKCNFILSVGGLMGTATQKVSDAEKSSQFAIVDSGSTGSNVYPMQFATHQASFLAGYLAAGYSKSGKVATFGGMKIPPVTIFMDGFADGVAYYNKQKSKNVVVLGWDKTKQAGSFTDDFASAAKGKALASTFVSQGADVILPVAGGTGLGAAEVATASSGKVSIIWVDQDGCKSAAQYCSVFLTTVVKNIEDAVEKAVVAGATGTPLAATPGYLGTLENNGVELAPYNQFDSKVDAGLKTEVEKLKADIISGAVKVESANAPK
ncbi:BMP family lipoprotein [Paractinoplanes durhamensis]|uniref:BMP family ABC transporter substrate-binding protein n=1 Tax=Paractinoplanes durhamensis TaxID=113563 RepID=A0ABQ3YPN8_9ACTN|nr:BMP family ABC transporter substrate-binding protein [Actinoplanes durhamensis]GID99516.1 BMP family ABC transporter substrate-binding protein [Actinoplanes durhamensis]